MRNEDYRAFIRVEIVLHEALGSDVEVVGWLVEEKDFRLGKEELGHRDAHLPAAGKFAAIAGEVALLEAKTIEDCLDPGLHTSWVVAVELEFEFSDLIEKIGIRGGTGVEIGEIFFESGDLVKDGLRFGKG